jgi:hypothetical protein
MSHESFLVQLNAAVHSPRILRAREIQSRLYEKFASMVDDIVEVSVCKSLHAKRTASMISLLQSGNA